MSKNSFFFLSFLNILFFRICDEEEEVSLHLRVKRNRVVPFLNPANDADIKPAIYNIDEYV